MNIPRILPFVLLSLPVAAQDVPPSFVENVGQWPEEQLFETRRPGLAARLEKDAVALHVSAGSEGGALLRLAFADANEDVRVEGGERLASRFHFVGGAESHAGAAAYADAFYRDLYPGIDLRLRDAGGVLEYDLLLDPGADVSRFSVSCEGAAAVTLDADGGLILTTHLGELRQSAPVAWQVAADGEEIPVEGRFVPVGDLAYSFQLVGLDAELPTVLDPGLEWSTFLGGNINEAVEAIAVHTDGSVYATGSTDSTDWPTTLGAYDEFDNPGIDVFVTKFDEDGTHLWSTYLGGGSVDRAFAIDVDAAGNPVVGGNTLSTDFPVSAGSLTATLVGGQQAFVTKLSSDGSALLWSTWLGGDRSETVHAIAIAPSGTVYVGGNTNSFYFPFNDTTAQTLNPFPYIDGAFVVSLGSGGSFGYNHFLVGEGTDFVYGLAVDSGGDPIAVGKTGSTAFPVTGGAYDTVKDGVECFIAKVSGPSPAAPAWATFVGGTNMVEQFNDVEVLSTGDICAVGYTRSSDYPTTAGVVKETVDNWDGVVSIVNSTGTTLVASTQFGGIGTEEIYGVDVGADDSISIAGRTFPNAFPATVGAFQTTPGFGGTVQDAFMARLNASLTEIEYATLFGGDKHDRAYDVELRPDGDAIVAGIAQSESFPVTAGAFDEVQDNTDDGFVLRIDPTSSCPASATTYGSGWPGTLGVPSIAASAPPVLDTSITIDVGNSLGLDSFGVAIVGFTEVAIPTAYGGTLLNSAEVIVPIATLPAAGVSIPYTIPPTSTFCGTELFVQGVVFDPGATASFSFTPGLKLLLGG